MNRAFRTSVRFLQAPFPGPPFADGSFDRVYCLSVIEHMTPEQFAQVVGEAHRVLRSGGRFIITADLFLDLAPFTSRSTNIWGRNYPVGQLLKQPGFRTVVGKPEELFGCAEFDHDKIQSELASYLVGDYPVLVQCIVLQKE